MDRAARNLSSEELLRAFERALSRVWLRVHPTLGDVTLGAIADRVIHNASQKFAILSVLTVDGGGIQFEGLRKSVAKLPEDELANALRFILVELLTVLGSLTAEILTP